jgi:hypothetical protein
MVNASDVSEAKQMSHLAELEKEMAAPYHYLFSLLCAHPPPLNTRTPAPSDRYTGSKLNGAW